jgi:hypothetical protein
MDKKLSIEDKIEKHYVLPCGPMDISAEGVCRKSLSQHMDKVLDRLTLEVNPEPPPQGKLQKGLEADDDGKIVEIPGETREEKKARLVKEGILRAEVREAIKQYQETLQGNSKLLQDITGRIEPW